MKVSTILKSKAFIKLAVIVIWLIIWQAIYAAVGKDVLLASPLAAFRRVAELAVTAVFWRSVASSLYRILLGFVAGVAAGILIAVVTSRSKLLYEFFLLPMNLVKATPVASFVILALVWVRGRNLSSLVSFLMVLPLVWSNVHTGIASVDKKLLEMAAAFKIGRRGVLKNIVFPSVLPYLLSALKVGLGFSWKAGIAGEVIAVPSMAIGTQLYNSKIYLETADLFAWTAVIILLSIVIERLMVVFIGKLSAKLNSLRGIG
jgi:NitT/TauT family transport system permease protein